MTRPASGREVLAKAKEMLANAKTVEELRQAQAVILPLEYGFSIAQVAAVTGISRGWVCQLRMRFIRNGGDAAKMRSQRGGRRRANMSIEEEKTLLAPFFDAAEKGGIVAVSDIRQALEAQLGRSVALGSVYNLLHRHHWQRPRNTPKTNV